ncbi:ParB/RepB/Spo0J family partition protein [Paenibacillus hexagrammi]|uniref:ParB/RepB/Spo0J family partition protein n=1 Tax=Paenibacillus hexagrammi TaxID=2908839 RepID=A0ABY3SNU8_9BACL|nr:ParB/RepB/Spo0J family partition protein [Paenibacillus sp. YPD9-1]UJF34914.1 ParB/RepB/Spo0J family partition protein [Paenibacillus sp. YPD9-1]
MDILDIRTELIDEDTAQPRYQFGEEALQELMKSIEELGILSPIKVRATADGRYKIIYGNRRYKASKALGRATIPCIVSAVTDETEIYLEQIAENLTREGFSPIEEAEAFDKLMNDPRFTKSIKYLSGKLGKPESYIKNKCDLLKFGPSIRKLIVSGTEIRKDQLTEDQLIPIKDLLMEHRDPLALIIARDELPVSDVKKIARLFKDSDMSDNTKGKLLYKSGRELLETWSVYNQNRTERAKSLAPKPAAKSKKNAQAEAAKEIAAGASTVAAAAANSAPSDPLQSAAASPAAAAVPAVSSIERKLKLLQTAIQEQAAAGTDSIQAPLTDKAAFLLDVDTLINELELQVSHWKQIREALRK